MNDIFLSYSREDIVMASVIVEALERHSFSIWWDQKIDHGDVFDSIIRKELNAAKCVMVLWSKKSVESEYVRAEATSGKNRLVPILIEDVNIPVPFNLIQTANLKYWNGDQSHPEFLKLLKSVSKKIGSPPPNEKEDKKPAINEPNLSVQQPHESVSRSDANLSFFR